jgi:hypothetical protein
MRRLVHICQNQALLSLCHGGLKIPLLREMAFFQIMLLASLFFTPFAYAEEAQQRTGYAPFAKSGEAVCRRYISDDHWLDRTENEISEFVCRAGVWFDSFFLDERDIEENVDRYIRVFNNFKYQDKEGLDWRLRVSARIELPGFEESLNLLISDEDERDLTQTTDDGTFTAHNSDEQNKTDNNRLAENHSLSLRWNMVRNPEQSFSMRLKLRLNQLLTPSLIGRYRYTHGLGQKALARYTQSIFWKRDEGFGETSRIDLERLLNPQMLLRWSNAATFSEASRGVDLGSALSLKHSLSGRAALSYDASVEGITSPRQATLYRLSMRYRQNFLRPWLFFEVEPFSEWPRDEMTNTLHHDIGVVFRLETHFGRKKRR